MNSGGLFWDESTDNPKPYREALAHDEALG